MRVTTARVLLWGSLTHSRIKVIIMKAGMATIKRKTTMNILISGKVLSEKKK
jgi:hypothetical protein